MSFFSFGVTQLRDCCWFWPIKNSKQPAKGYDRIIREKICGSPIFSYYYFILCAFSRKNKYYMDVRTRTDIANKVFIVMHFLKIRFPVFNT